MQLADLATAGLRHHRRSHVAVALGVIVATAVLTGALLVGDSVRGSLRNLTLKRLGNIDHVLVTPQPFRAQLVDELRASPKFASTERHVDAAWLLRGSLSHRGDNARRYASGVSVIGAASTFGKHGAAWANSLGDGATLTAPLADELGVRPGDQIVLRLPAVSAQPADSALGEKADTTISRRMKVARVIDAEAPLARFSLSPSQRPPRSVFVAIELIQDLFDQPETANALLVDGLAGDTQSVDNLLAASLRPTLEDYRLTLQSVGDAVQLEADQLVLPGAIVDATHQAFTDQLQPVVTYLANTIRSSDKSVPYSTVSGVESNASGPLLDEKGEPITLADNEVVLNDWTAKQLDAKLGDTITLTYYEPESTHGELIEAEPVELKLKAIVPITGTAGDRRLTPILEGVTDADSIDDWDLPFDLVEPISRADEDYWDDHSTTPKAFVSLELAKRLWATRWGSISLLRIPNTDPATVAEKLRDAIDPVDLGFVFQPVKRLGLEASAGSTPFDGLFFGFSMFLIASAVLLIVLLFGLGVGQRAREIGLLAAVGWDPKHTRRLLMGEGLAVALVGVAIGLPTGVLYAWLMITGLTTVWVAAIAAPFLELHITFKSLAIGALLGLVFAWWAIRRTLRAEVARSPRSLLSGLSAASVGESGASRATTGWLVLLCLACAVGLGVAATGLQGESQAAAFFGSGALLLTGLLLATWKQLRRTEITSPAPKQFGGWSLALRNVARAPGRSLLTIALVACASFLILAISAFRLDPTEEGTGGFVLVGQSDQPIHFDINTPAGRLDLSFSPREEQLLDQFTVYALRVYDGEDASCLNLYQTRQPRILGAPQTFLERGGFTFAGGDTKRLQSETVQGSGDTTPSEIPTVVDFNTAMYSLKLYGGVGSQMTIHDGVDRPVEVQVAGLLKNSILQGDLLVSETDFLKLYPATGGYRFFLIEPKTDSANPAQLAAMLEDRLSDYGFDTEEAVERLAGFLAVQNTYLSTFQSLGALGLLLGAVGVAVVQLRNLAERRGELALLRAAGFDIRSLRTLLFRENLTLLGAGFLVGMLAAAVALLPQSLIQQTQPPWLTTSLLLAAIAAIGLVVGTIATGWATRAPIVAALRGDF